VVEHYAACVERLLSGNKLPTYYSLIFATGPACKTATTRERLMAIAALHGAKIIDPVANLCQGNICPTVSETGEPYFVNHLHMRPFYVRDKATFIDGAVLVKRSTKEIW